MRWNTYRKKHTALIRERGCGEKKEETERYSVWREKKQRSRIQVVSCGDNKQQSSQHVWTESTWRESRNRAGLCRPEHHRRELDLLCNTRRERERSETGLQIKNRNTYSYTQYTQKHNVELEHTQHTAEIGYIRDSINRAVIFIQWWISAFLYLIDFNRYCVNIGSTKSPIGKQCHVESHNPLIHHTQGSRPHKEQVAEVAIVRDTDIVVVDLYAGVSSSVAKA